jgi:hypothetical protein
MQMTSLPGDPSRVAKPIDQMLSNGESPTPNEAHPKQMWSVAIAINWLLKHRRALFELTTFLLAVTAIIFACIQFGDSRAQLASLTVQTGKIEAVTSSIITRYVGEFPKNLDDITPVVRNVTDEGELDIMTDHPGYAIYSRNEAYEDYFSRLVEAHRKKKARVKMLVYDKDLASTALNTQFSEEDFKDEHNRNFRSFFDDRPPVPAARGEFITRILALQNEVIHQLCQNGIQVRRVPPSDKYLFFLWLTSNPEAVFAFRNEAARNREISFHTVDPALIGIFKTVFDQTWLAADPETHPAFEASEDQACHQLHTFTVKK